MGETLAPSFKELRETVCTTRSLFPEGKIGRGIYRSALQLRTPQELGELREQFGPGVAGKKAFLIIATGTVCEVKSTSNGGEKCEKKGVGTVDFDMHAELEQAVFCEDHQDTVYGDVKASLGEAIPWAVAGMGINGRGRH